MKFPNNLIQILEKNSNLFAFCIEDKYYQYSELIDCIHKIHNDLPRNLKIKRIGILCENNIDTYAAILACWMNGLAFVPILNKNPIERNLAILKEANVSTVICTKKIPHNLYSDNYKILHTYVSNPNNLEDIISKDINPDNEAYVLFTSGSTGTPKGVPISFENLQGFLEAFKKTGFDLEKHDRCLQMFELTFDVSISSFLTALLAGSCVFTVSDKSHKYIDVFRIINKYKLTSIQIVPSILKLGQHFLKRIDFSSVQTCILTGEASSIVEVESFQNFAPQTTIFNFYGPTESTIYCSSFKIDNNKVKEYNGMVSIGKPFDNSSFLLLNNEDEIIKDNRKGELWISSPQLTKGYLNDNLNEKSFRIINNQRYYKTGDLCFLDEEGDYLYCGRIDNQIQIQGFRVELGEIEYKTREKTGLNCVAVDVTKNNFTEIILFLESASNIDSKEIMSVLKEVLPNYMLPQRIIELSTFPLTQSGKTDRVALRSIITEKQ